MNTDPGKLTRIRERTAFLRQQWENLQEVERLAVEDWEWWLKELARVEQERDEWQSRANTMLSENEEQGCQLLKLKGEWPATDGSPMGIANAKLAALEARCARLLDLLETWGAHAPQCVRCKWEAGRPTADGSYQEKFCGVWYESKPVDRTPPCDCGWQAVLDTARGAG